MFLAIELYLPRGLVDIVCHVIKVRWRRYFIQPDIAWLRNHKACVSAIGSPNTVQCLQWLIMSAFLGKTGQCRQMSVLLLQGHIPHQSWMPGKAMVYDSILVEGEGGGSHSSTVKKSVSSGEVTSEKKNRRGESQLFIPALKHNKRTFCVLCVFATFPFAYLSRPQATNLTVNMLIWIKIIVCLSIKRSQN